MAQGKVKWFDSKKGFGFIEQDEGADLFVHFSELKDEGFKTLNEGDVVEYNVTQGPKGESATDVKVVSRSETAPRPPRQPRPERPAKSYGREHSDNKPFNRSIEDQLKALR